MIGKFPDSEVAKRTGHPIKSVRQSRWGLGIAYENPSHRSWTPEEDALLNTMPDHELAKRIHRTVGAIRLRRYLFRQIRRGSAFAKSPSAK